ncbi:MAG: hypothetical protein HYT87_19340 [Nitrospirae bacterium]|nr:hypothetical protein [Nitrospirota bacterium]
MIRRISLILSLWLLGSASASALPRFAVREGMTCGACHVNPSGGGMRNAYGSQVYERLDLPLTRIGKVWAPPEVGPLRLGADSRSAYIYIPSQEEGVTSTSSFFQMQADLYASAKLHERLNLYYDQGLNGTYEAMGIISLPWAGSFVKVGRFIPTYGWRLDNHRTFVREDIGFAPREKETGIEFGIRPGPFLVQLDVFNGVGGKVNQDNNTEKAATARVEYGSRLGQVPIMLGLSSLYNLTGSRETAEESPRRIAVRDGVIWGASYGRLGYLGEADWFSNRDLGAKKTVRGWVLYEEANVIVRRGLEIQGLYEYTNPDFDLEGDLVHRVGGGFEMFPIPYLEFKMLYRRSVARSDNPIGGISEVIGMVHVFF